MNYTPTEAADRLKVPENTLAFWRSTGQGPKWFKVGRHPRYRSSALDQWEEEQEAKQTAKSEGRSSRASA